MKRREYLRGIGLGVLVTSAIFTIYNSQNKMTDSEIIQKAVELGAVYEEPKVYLEAEPTQIPNASAIVEVSAKPKETESPVITEKPLETEEPSAEPATEPTAEPTAEPTLAPQPSESPEPSEEPQPSEKPAEEVEVYVLTIERGYGSMTVCNLLEEAGVIESAKDFDKYLVKNGYESRIRVGVFNIPMNSSWNEIAETIAGKIR